MSEADRRRDPRAEPLESERPSRPLVERPFEREESAAPKPPMVVDLGSTSEVRAVSRKDPRAEVESLPPSESAVVAAPTSASLPLEPARARAPSEPDLIDFERPQSKAVAMVELASVAQPEPEPEVVAPTPAPVAAPSAPLVTPAAVTSTPSLAPSSGPDSLLATVEHLVNEARWETICEVLGPAERAAELPPHLALVYAIARAEAHPEDAGAVELMIRSTARAHGLSEGSAIARVIAKRIVRRSPTDWRKRQAPPRTISLLIVFITLVLGGGGGFWLSTTKVQIPLPAFMHTR